MLASVSLMVPASQLARVAGLNQTLEGASLIAAPGLAAVLVSVLPIQLVLAIDGITALLAVLPVALILIPEPAAGGARGKAAPFLEAFREGFAHLAGVKGLLFLFVYGSAAWMLAVPAWRLLPLLATEHLGGGAIQLGMMSSAFGAGIVAGGAILGVWGGFKRRVLTCCTARIGTGVGLLVLGLAPADGFSLALATCAALGATTSLSMGAQRALIQATVPPELQGRIFGIFTAALSVLQPIGFSLFGAFGDLLGPSRVFVIGGASVLALGALMGLTPPLMRMEQVGTAGEGGPQPATAA
jgi:DHA3 family macrolide efflux protein-like MFS transporter